MSKVWSVGTVCLLATAAHAQTVVAGKVIDRANKNPVWPASVVLLSETDSVLQQGATLRDGTFSFMVPSAGTYRVRITTRELQYLGDWIKVADGEYAAHEFPIPLSELPYREWEVDAHVVPLMHSPMPHFPDELRQQGVSGCALAEFVVDSTGHAELATLKFPMVTHGEFARAVREALPRMTFAPAELRGKKVRQIVMQPFTFTVTGTGDFDVHDCDPPRPKLTPRRP